MFRIIKKADIILFICLILIGGALSYLAFSGSSTGDLVVVKVNGEIYGKYSLTKDRTITVNRDGHMNKICVKQGSISTTHQNIVCIPNRVVVSIEGKGGEYDVISQ